MSSETRYLALRLEGPLQSWGVDSQYSRRNTGLMPTKSAIAGICCAASRFPRGGDGERVFLERFAAVRMTAIAIPRPVKRGDLGGANGRTLQVRRLEDYHTVQNTRKADGSIKDCHITYRQYLTDASFGVLIEGCAVLLREVADALADPKWGIWLGRKTCIPSAPVLAGLCDSRDEALRLLIGDRPLESFTRQEDADSFAEGRDSLPDQPVSFASDRRAGGCPHAPRRVVTHQGKMP
jgi:CRISPR system Cascade subunit CasD